jgi:hypothetical protein
MQALLKCGKRNLTAEIAELAEVEKAKGLSAKWQNIVNTFVAEHR